ncbi:type II toxin-antitoxin system PemK/MazF family toxin [Brachybacterium huguangmaarense]
MSFTSRLRDLLGAVVRSPSGRRIARDLGEAAVDAVDPEARRRGTRRRSGRRGTSTNTKTATTRTRRGTSNRSTGRRTRSTPTATRAHRGASGAAPTSGPLADRPSMPAIALTFSPVDDDRADPGEIVWSWVAYEEDITRGKDRPVLVLAREDAAVGGRDGDGPVLVALMLTSHDRGAGVHVDEHGNTWIDIGTGPWDSRGRASEVRADRLLRLPIDAVRREGSALDRARFDAVAEVVAQVHGWDR